MHIDRPFPVDRPIPIKKYVPTPYTVEVFKHIPQPYPVYIEKIIVQKAHSHGHHGYGYRQGHSMWWFRFNLLRFRSKSNVTVGYFNFVVIMNSVGCESSHLFIFELLHNENKVCNKNFKFIFCLFIAVLCWIDVLIHKRKKLMRFWAKKCDQWDHFSFPTTKVKFKYSQFESTFLRDSNVDTEDTVLNRHTQIHHPKDESFIQTLCNL